MINPAFTRVTPLVAWAVFLIVFSTSTITFLVCEPIVHGIFVTTSSEIPDQAVGASNVFKLEYYAIPVVIDVLLAFWAFLVTTRRQPVTTPGAYF